jgi:bacteriocin-like protein
MGNPTPDNKVGLNTIKMEKITKIEFQRLDTHEMQNVTGGKKLVLHYDCVGGMGGSEPVSVDVWKYNWFERTFLGKDQIGETYDKATNCSVVISQQELTDQKNRMRKVSEKKI